jgi:hypothetical protein
MGGKSAVAAMAREHRPVAEVLPLIQAERADAAGVAQPGDADTPGCSEVTPAPVASTTPTIS